MFLVVLGTTPWMSAEGRFEPGVHEISDAFAARVRELRLRKLVVREDRPDVELKRPPRTGGALRLSDLNEPQPAVGVGISLPRPQVVEYPPESPAGIPFDYGCTFCPARFPSSGARQRHMQFHHSP